MSRLLQFFRTSQGRYLLLGVFVFMITLGFLRGCSHSTSFTHPRYNIAVDRSWYPLALYGKEKNLLAFTDDLLEAIAEESGLRFNLVEVGTPNLIQDLENRTYDGILSALTPTAYTLSKYHFSEPLYLMGPVLVVMSSSEIKSLEELANRSIGIRRGMSLAFDTPFPKARIVPYDKMSNALSDLEDGRVDAVIMDSMQAYLQIQGIYSGKVKIVTTPLRTEAVRLVALSSSENQELIELFNTALFTLKENGTYEQLLQGWGLFNPLIQDPVKM